MFTVATDEKLRSKSHQNRLKMTVLNLDIAQRDYPTVIQQMFLEEDGKGTTYQYAPDPYPVPLVDDVWENERWVRIFLNSVYCDDLEKIRVLDLFFRIRYPYIARHFGR